MKSGVAVLRFFFSFIFTRRLLPDTVSIVKHQGEEEVSPAISLSLNQDMKA